jgi:hypothetical protein
MLLEHPCRPRDWKGSHSPRSLASGLPCDPSSLPRQEIALRFFLPVSPDRALVDVLPSNTWRARSHRLASEPTDLPRAKPLACDHDSPSYTRWRGTNSSICTLPPGHSHRPPQPVHSRHVWQDTGTVPFKIELEPPIATNPPALNSNPSTPHLIGTRGKALLCSSLAENQAGAHHSPSRADRGCRPLSLPLYSLSVLSSCLSLLATLTPKFPYPGIAGRSPPSSMSAQSVPVPSPSVTVLSTREPSACRGRPCRADTSQTYL